MSTGRPSRRRHTALLGGERSLPLILTVFCRDLSHRVRYDAWVALRKLTMLELPCVPIDWLDFWKKRSGEVAEGEPNPWGKTFPRPARNAIARAPRARKMVARGEAPYSIHSAMLSLNWAGCRVDDVTSEGNDE